MYLQNVFSQTEKLVRFLVGENKQTKLTSYYHV